MATAQRRAPKRGWWVSVEFNQSGGGRKDQDHVMALMATAGDRYDMVVPSGHRVSRAIFSVETDSSALATLVERVRHWDSTVICVNGEALENADITQWLKMMACASGRRLCRTGSVMERMAFIGCHLQQIGLGGYRLEEVKRGRAYWFSAFDAQPMKLQQYRLSETYFVAARRTAIWCPAFPGELFRRTLERLPKQVNLRNPKDRSLWVAAKYRMGRCRPLNGPAVVPVSESAYRRWFNTKVMELAHRW